jgi:hypothetical protein
VKESGCVSACCFKCTPEPRAESWHWPSLVNHRKQARCWQAFSGKSAWKPAWNARHAIQIPTAYAWPIMEKAQMADIMRRFLSQNLALERVGQRDRAGSAHGSAAMQFKNLECHLASSILILIDA